MIESFVAFVLLAAIVAVSLGLVLIPRRLSVALAATRSNPAAEAAVVAQALAEVHHG